MVEIVGREVLLKDENGEVIIPYVEKPDLTNFVDLSSNQEIGGIKTLTSGETRFLLGEFANCRFISSDKKYGVMARVDENDFYFLLTNADDPNGVWSAIRPFKINLATGVLSSEANAYVPDAHLANSVVVTQAISKGSDGYVKFGNGLIIQWGTVKSPNKYTFSTPFTLTPRVVIGRVNSGATNGTRTPVAHSVSTTGFTAYWYNSESVTYNWIAIGV